VHNVFIITPSYLIKKKSDFTAGIRELAKLGFNVLNPEFPKELPSPQDKAAQIHTAYSDPGTDMILAQRGGYSAMKSLPYIDFDLIKKHPKIIAGFSDLSALLNPIYERTGVVTLHAPMVINLDAPTAFTVGSFLNAVKGYPEKPVQGRAGKGLQPRHRHRHPQGGQPHHPYRTDRYRLANGDGQCHHFPGRCR